MTIILFVLNKYPNRIAISKSVTDVSEYENKTAFFLDFSKPLKTIKWFGVTNDLFGFAVGLKVPVIHESEETASGFIVSAHISDPYFKTLRRLWKDNYPASNPPPIIQCDPLYLIAEFASQFAEDNRTPN